MNDEELRAIRERHEALIARARPYVVQDRTHDDRAALLAYVEELRASLDGAYKHGAHTEGTSALCTALELKEGRHSADSVQRLAADDLAAAQRVVEAARAVLSFSDVPLEHRRQHWIDELAAYDAERRR